MAMFHVPKPLKPRGIRFSLPMGFVLGRVSPGYGDAELIPITELGQNLTKAKAIPTGGGGIAANGGIAELLFFVAGGPTLSPNQYFYSAIAPCDMTFPDPDIASVAKCGIAPVVSSVFYLVNDPAAYGVSGPPTGVIATITFGAASTTGSIAWGAGAPYSVAKDDVLYLFTSPTFSELTIEGINMNFVGEYVSG